MNQPFFEWLVRDEKSSRCQDLLNHTALIFVKKRQSCKENLDLSRSALHSVEMAETEESSYANWAAKLYRWKNQVISCPSAKHGII